MLTFGEFKAIVAPYAGRAGKCESAPEVAAFARKVMEYLLYSGSNAGTRKVCIIAHKGCISMPPEVETPLKVRIDFRVTQIWNKWFSYHSTGDGFEKCLPIGDVLIEDGSSTPLSYELPDGGSVLGVLAHCEESPESFVLVSGKDPTGREIFGVFKGAQTAGEFFTLEKGVIHHGKVTFGEITSVTKSRTNGYVSLYAIDLRTGRRQFLADWSPSEEIPTRRRFRVIARECPPMAHLSILCRVRLKENYHDNENTFFDNTHAVELAAQKIQGEVNNDLEVANYKRGAVEDILEKESGYKKISGNPVDVFFPMSGGRVRNIVGRW
jgi:hypothetical protein